MSLKTFHIVFIAASAALAFGFGHWCWHEQGARFLSGLSVAAGIGLLAYEIWFLRKMRGVSFL